jgi:hypothetical protein
VTSCAYRSWLLYLVVYRVVNLLSWKLAIKVSISAVFDTRLVQSLVNVDNACVLQTNEFCAVEIIQMVSVSSEVPCSADRSASGAWLGTSTTAV